MARVIDGDQMIESVRNRTMTPDDTSIFTDDDILDILDEEMNMQVLDKLQKLHGDNLTITVDLERNDDGEYEIPYRALGNKLRDISLVNGNVLYELAQISIGELPDYTFAEDSNSYLDKFYVENNKIKLIQNSRNYSKIRVRYYLRPNMLTKKEKAGVISEVITDSVAGTLTLSLSKVGRNFNESSLYDIVAFRSPNNIKAFDLTPISLTVAGGVGNIVLNLSELKGVEKDIKTGDFLTIAEETPVPNIPTEMHPLLAQAAAVQLLEALGDTEAFNTAEKRLMKMTAASQELIDARVELAPKKIKPRHSTLSGSIGPRRGKGRY